MSEYGIVCLEGELQGKEIILEEGEKVKVKITTCDSYNLYGEIID